MTSSQKALPWLVSLGAHLVLLPAAAILLAAPSRSPYAPHVEITLVGAPGTGHGAPRAAGSPDSGTFVPRPPRGQTVASSTPPSAASSPAARKVLPPRDMQPATRNESLPTPSAGEVLADMAASSASSTKDEGAATAIGSPMGTQVGWEGMPRRLIRRRTPEFPRALGALGQEIEGEARISVAPSGIVTRVEITSSSGYIEIDASVEAALRDFLFSRVDGRAETVGTVHFRYRLEKQD